MALAGAVLAAVLGALTSLPLLAFAFAGSVLFGLPFFPFDVFDWLARVLPGWMITPVIDALVALFNSLRLGPTATLAKVAEQAMALGLASATATAVAVVLYAGVVRGLRPGWWAGLALGGLLAVILLVVESARGLDLANTLHPVWLVLPLLAWGAALGLLVERLAAAPAAETAPAASRRVALAKIAAGSVGIALALWGAGALAERDRPPAPGTPPRQPEPGTEPVATLPEPPPGRIEPAWGTRLEVTPNVAFYRVDINLLPVRLDGADWRLKIAGLFDRPRDLTLADLRAMPAVTQPVTLTCISNPVGGDLISNAYWTGVRLRDLLAELGMRPETKEVFLRSADGFYETVTAADMMDERTLLAYGMNGVTLPVEHGYPLRILIPDRYGMKQPKWIIYLEAKGKEERRGYWPEREWSEEALVQIMSQVDAAAPDEVDKEKVVIGGIAFTGAQGVSKVEVQVENGPWEEARLRTPPLGPLTWVQWRYEWPRQPGTWNFRARATDSRGNLQIARRAGPRPDGATGYHVISRTV